MRCDVGEVAERLENEQSSYVTDSSLTSPGEPPMDKTAEGINQGSRVGNFIAVIKGH